MKKDDTLFGSLAFDSEKDQEVLVLYLWENQYADKTVTFANVVSKKDFKKYNVEFDKLVHIGE